MRVSSRTGRAAHEQASRGPLFVTSAHEWPARVSSRSATNPWMPPPMTSASISSTSARQRNRRLRQLSWLGGQRRGRRGRARSAGNGTRPTTVAIQRLASRLISQLAHQGKATNCHASIAQPRSDLITVADCYRVAGRGEGRETAGVKRADVVNRRDAGPVLPCCPEPPAGWLISAFPINLGTNNSGGVFAVFIDRSWA